jgi:hypothetical protein
MIQHSKPLYIYFKATLLLFLLSAFYGWLMRLNALVDIPYFSYSKILQAHSHVTFLGWGYVTVTVLFNTNFLPKNIAFSKKYKIIFAIQLLSITLMLLSFPLQGYKVFSIVLLSVFALSSYVYFYFFYHDYKQYKPTKIVALFIKSAIFYYLLAMCAIWVVGAVVATQGKGELYQNTIYFYLHFLYNGFFIFALFALFFQYLNQYKNMYLSAKANRFFWLLQLACIPSYLLSLVKMDNIWITSIGFLAASLQVFALFYFIQILEEFKAVFKNWTKYLLTVVSVSFILKIILQFGSAFPFIGHKLPQLKSFFVIGYIHLVTLGIISTMLIVFLVLYGFLNLKKTNTQFFLFGVISTEILFFLQGFLLEFFQYMIPHYSLILFGFSTVLVTGIFLIFMQFKLKSDL